MPEMKRYEDTMAELREIPDEHFKTAFLDYIETNEHDLSWEGFASVFVNGFQHIMTDFLLAYRSDGLRKS
jgi:hypothetical protein